MDDEAGNCTLQNISFFPPGVLRTSHLALPEASAGEAFGKIRFYQDLVWRKLKKLFEVKFFANRDIGWRRSKAATYLVLALSWSDNITST